MKKKLYGVFSNIGRNDRWGMTNNKRVAINAAKEIKGATVRSMNDPDSKVWDAPTFRACSEQIYPTVAPAVLPLPVCGVSLLEDCL